MFEWEGGVVMVEKRWWGGGGEGEGGEGGCDGAVSVFCNNE